MDKVITGSAGFLGGKLHMKLPALGIDLKEGKNVLTCDLPEAKVIYHLAAQTSVEASWHDPVNDSYNFNMMVRLVKEYPESRIIYAQSGSMIEASSPYGFSKKICGDYLKQFHTNYVICVFPNVFGGGKGVTDIFKGKDEVTIYGDGLQVRDFVHADDIIEGLLQAQDWPTGEYFMGSGKGTRIIDLARGKKIIFAPARKEMRESILPNTTPSWTPKISVFEYLQ